MFSLCSTIFGFFFSLLGFLFLFSSGSLTIVLASNSFLPFLLESVKFSFANNDIATESFAVCGCHACHL